MAARGRAEGARRNSYGFGFSTGAGAGAGVVGFAAGVDAGALLATFPGGTARHVPRDRLPAALAEAAVPGDLVLCLGAGDITGVPTELLTLLEAKALS